MCLFAIYWFYWWYHTERLENGGYIVSHGKDDGKQNDSSIIKVMLNHACMHKKKWCNWC